MIDPHPLNNSKLPKISLIAAYSDNLVIGNKNTLPWHLPKDLAFFKEHTQNKPIIMGKKTWDSIGRILPNRPNVILSRSLTECPKGAYVFRSFEEAIDSFKSSPEIMIIGGAEIFNFVLQNNWVSRLYLTKIHATVEGDSFIPSIDFSKFIQMVNIFNGQDEKHCYDFSFEIWDKKSFC